MITKASVRGRAMHPMLVVFPLGLFTAGLVALIAFLSSDDPFFYRVAYLAMLTGGVVAVPTAVLGLIDLTGVPRDSRAKPLGIVHAAFALSTTALFVAAGLVMLSSWAARTDTPLATTLPLALSTIGIALLGGTGLLGWHMVSQHHVGVTPIPDRFRARLPSVLTHGHRAEVSR